MIKVVIAVRNLDESAKRYRAAYGTEQPLKQVDVNFGAHLALLGGTPVVLAEPLHSQTWLAARLEQFGEGPCAFILGARKPGKYKAASKSRWLGWTSPGSTAPVSAGISDSNDSFVRPEPHPHKR